MISLISKLSYTMKKHFPSLPHLPPPPLVVIITGCHFPVSQGTLRTISEWIQLLSRHLPRLVFACFASFTEYI